MATPLSGTKASPPAGGATRVPSGTKPHDRRLRLDDILKLMLAGHPPEVFGDGLQSRDLTYVDNAVRACLLAAINCEASAWRRRTCAM